MKVSSLMHPDPIICHSHDDLQRAAQLMWEHDIGCLPVLDDDGHVVGMITDRDICMSAYTRGSNLRSIPVASAMSRGVHACGPDDDLKRVEEAMQQFQVRRMPVIDAKGHPVGLISLNDIARRSQRGGVSAGEVASTLAAICAPRPLLVTGPQA
ncbi:MAG: CBS domain-containing protein [Deltaproteobacteria bacterium]|nr:CBS domain-containing protein [Kofleriaceae bacterium]